MTKLTIPIFSGTPNTVPFMEWKARVRMVIKAKELGHCLLPPPPALANREHQAAAVAQREKDDNKVLALISSVLSSSIHQVHQVHLDPLPHVLWATLEAHYTNTAAANAQQLRTEYHSSRIKPTQTLAEYVNHLRQLVVQMTAVGTTTTDPDLCAKVLFDLEQDPYYKDPARLFTAKPAAEQTLPLLLQWILSYETRNPRAKATDSASVAGSDHHAGLLSTTSNRPPPTTGTPSSNAKVTCQYCSKLGHTALTCYAIPGNTNGSTPKGSSNKYCTYHNAKSHNTHECKQKHLHNDQHISESHVAATIVSGF